MPNVLASGTPHEKGFLVFGVPNAKYLAFGTPDGNALMASNLYESQSSEGNELLIFFYKYKLDF